MLNLCSKCFIAHLCSNSHHFVVYCIEFVLFILLRFITCATTNQFTTRPSISQLRLFLIVLMLNVSLNSRKHLKKTFDFVMWPLFQTIVSIQMIMAFFCFCTEQSDVYLNTMKAISDLEKRLLKIKTNNVHFQIELLCGIERKHKKIPIIIINNILVLLQYF